MLVSEMIAFTCWACAFQIMAVAAARLVLARARILGWGYGLSTAMLVVLGGNSLPSVSTPVALVLVGAPALLGGLFAQWQGLRLRPAGHAMLMLSGSCLAGALLCLILPFAAAGSTHDILAGFLAAVTLGGVAYILFFSVAVLNPQLNMWLVRLETARLHGQAHLAQRPFVSILVPCYAEPPEIVIRTLEALDKLDYDDYEVLVIDNNTTDERLWRPLESFCAARQDRFRFFHVSPLSGHKAGALNYAHQRLHSRSTIVGLVDADYVARPNFLASFVPLMAAPNIAFVQTSHDYAGWEDGIFLRVCYFAYVYFSKLAMPGLNELGAGFPIGTMLLVKREAIDVVGGWAEWCQTEDFEISVRLARYGYEGVVVGDTAGHGLLPANFADVKKQIFRWSAGPIEQLIRYGGEYLGRLANRRKYPTIQTLFMLRNHLHYALNTLPFLSVLTLLILAFLTSRHDAGVALPLGLLAFWWAHGLFKLADRWIALNAMGSRRLSDYLGLLAFECAVVPVQINALLAAVVSRGLKWKRTPKFGHEGSWIHGIAAAAPEMAAGLALIALALTLAGTTSSSGFSLAIYASIRAAWLGFTCCLALWVSLAAERTVPATRKQGMRETMLVMESGQPLGAIMPTSP